LTGMALPFILFPTAITGSLSVMLLPHIAAAQSGGAFDRVNASAGFSIRYSLYIGILFAGLFLRFGEQIGPVVFGNDLAGSFLTVLAWLCPFLYVSGTAGSVINGLGDTKTTFFHSAASLAVRLLFVVLLIPRMGIRAYLYGLLASELILTFLHLFFLRKKIELPFSPVYELLRPAASALLSMGISRAWESLPLHDGLPAFLDLAVSGILFAVCFLFFLFVTRREKKPVR
ncbi:MAG: polysaccharide biosynthesis protein, partial [Lachnospiraceae bacterium]|nr:polysaccharide biosynthesis protein [Lachnospiraceae bacterium]